MNEELSGTESPALSAEPAPSLEDNIAFLLNVGRLIGQDAFEVAPGHVLRRATQTERQFITTILSRIPGGFFPPVAFMWDVDRQPDSTLRQLAPEESRYFVIAFKGSNDTLLKIEEAFDLAPLELEVGFTALASPGIAVTFNPGRLFHVLENVRVDARGFFVDVSAGDLEVVQTIRQKLEQHDHTLVDLKRLVVQLRDLKALPHSSPLRFLGYFAILEALLTHPPKSTDPYDTITRQVKMKVALLNNRWAAPLDYGPFGGVSHNTIWTKMYGYRSLVAHGGTTDFTGEFQVLADHENALTLIKDTVKAVMRQALTEPRLLLDLRDC